MVRYEYATLGAMLHMDTKKLGRIERPSHRVTGNRHDSVDGAGWEFAHVAIDDHSRVGFVQMHADEHRGSAVDFLQAAVAHYAALGVKASLGSRPSPSCFPPRWEKRIATQHLVGRNASTRLTEPMCWTAISSNLSRRSVT